MEKKWGELLDFVHKNRGAAASDELLKAALKTFEDELFKEIQKADGNPAIEEYIEQLFLLDRSRIYKLSEARSAEVVVHIVNASLKRSDVASAYKYAKVLPTEPTCAKVIAEYEATLPRVIPHSQSNYVVVTENANVSDIDHSISLFKSQQEATFFMALRRVFPRYDVYPNVALSCLIDYDAVSSLLSPDEKDLFFKGVVDSVVYDQFNDYKPLYCFELDSVHHDSSKQKAKDAAKSNLLAKAGVRLLRVRHQSGSPTEQEFMLLIKDVLKV